MWLVIVIAFIVWRLYRWWHRRRVIQWWHSSEYHDPRDMHAIAPTDKSTSLIVATANDHVLQLPVADTIEDYQRLAMYLEPTDFFYWEHIRDFAHRHPTTDPDMHQLLDELAGMQPIDPPPVSLEERLVAAKSYVSDSENTHDSSVNIRINESLRRLASTTPLIVPVDDLQLLEAGVPPIVISTIATGTPCVTFNDMSDKDVLHLVWNRIHVPANQYRYHDLFRALVDALKSCCVADSVVCVNGRIARLVESLTLIDYDPEVGQAVSTQDIRNAVLEECQRALTSELERLRESDPDLYSRILNDEDDSQFGQTFKVQVDTILDAYRHRLTSLNHQSIKEFVCTALDL